MYGPVLLIATISMLSEQCRIILGQNEVLFFSMAIAWFSSVKILLLGEYLKILDCILVTVDTLEKHVTANCKFIKLLAAEVLCSLN